MSYLLVLVSVFLGIFVFACGGLVERKLAKLETGNDAISLGCMSLALLIACAFASGYMWRG